MGHKKSIGLRGGPNEYITDISEFVSIEGYKRNSPDVNNPFNLIDSGSITMEGVDFPVMGTDNLGNSQMMTPGNNYQFPGNQVFEIPIAQTGGGVNKEGVKQYKWFKNYIKSPKYTERLKKEFPDYSNEQIVQEVKTRLNNVMQTRVGFLPRSSKYSEGPEDTQGFYGNEDFPNTMMLRPEYSASTSDEIFEPGNYLSEYKTIPLHEWSHVVDNVGKRIPQSTTDLMLSKMKENILDRPKDQYYYTKPTEYLGRMQPLRYLMQQEGLYDAGTQDFTKEDLEKAKQNKTIKNNIHFQDLMDNVKSDEGFIELMNNVASTNNLNSQRFNIPIAKRGGGLLNKTMECNSCGWEWKAADGGNDVSTCHKCGGSALPQAQDGVETTDGRSQFRNQATVSAYEEPAWYEKALDILASPMTAFGYTARNQDVPYNLPINMEERHVYDSFIDTINPFAWIKYGAQADRDYDQGNYLDSGLNALGAIPVVPAWLKYGKYAKDINKLASYVSKPIINNVKKNLTQFINDPIKMNNPFGFQRIGDIQPPSDLSLITPKNIDLTKGFDNYAEELSKIEYAYGRKHNDQNLSENYFEGIAKLTDQLNKNITPFGKRLDSGMEGTVYEFANYPKSVLKYAHNYADNLSDINLPKEAMSFRDNATAIPLKAQKIFDKFSNTEGGISLMDNLNKVGLDVPLKLSKRDAYADLLKRARKMRDSGIEIDAYNTSNIKFNKDKGVYDIYDLQAGKGDPTYMKWIDQQLRPGQMIPDKGSRFDYMYGGSIPMAQDGTETEEKSVWGFVKELAKVPGADISNLLGVMGIPANLIAEATESLTGRGDGEFNFMDAIPSFATPGSDDELFTFTNQNGTPVKNVAALEDADGNPLVENPVGAFITNLATDPSTYVGAGVAKNVANKVIQGGLKRGLRKTIAKNVTKYIPKNTYKYNPFAYNNINSKLPEFLQLNKNNEKWLRQVGKPAIVDAQTTRTVREIGEKIDLKAFALKLEELKNAPRGQFQLNKRYNGPFFKKGETFFDYNKTARSGLDGLRNTRGRSGSSDFLMEFNPSDLTKYKGMDSYFQPAYMQIMQMDPKPFNKFVGDIGIMKPKMRDVDNFNFYKKDPIRGYKKTPLDELQPGGETGEYKVQKGDTFYGIANKNNVSWDTLKEANPNVNIESLGLNQSIVIPKAINRSPAMPENQVDNSNVLDYKSISNYLVDSRGGTMDTWGQLADTIAFHESSPWSRMDPKAKQYKGGPGRGLFQFEGESFNTALKRYKNVAAAKGYTLKDSIVNAKSADELSSEDQYALFYANLIESKTKLSDFVDGNISSLDVWLSGHKNVEADGDRNSFLESKTAAEKEGIKNGYKTFQEGGKIENNIMYKNYIDGVYTGSKMESKAEKIYDKLNRVHYKDAKKANMSSPNYIMTHIYKA